jgi:cob(I)alamin adenosyltransferase
MNAFIRAAAMSVEFQSGEDDIRETQQALDGITSLLATLTEVEAPIASFQSTVSALPRMTSELNRSKRQVVDVLQRFIDQLHKAQNLTREAEAVVKVSVNAKQE